MVAGNSPTCIIFYLEGKLISLVLCYQTTLRFSTHKMELESIAGHNTKVFLREVSRSRHKQRLCHVLSPVTVLRGHVRPLGHKPRGGQQDQNVP